MYTCNTYVSNICTSIYVLLYVNEYIWNTYVCIHIYQTFVYIYIPARGVYTFAYTYTYLYICTYIFVHMYIHTYITFSVTFCGRGGKRMVFALLHIYINFCFTTCGYMHTFPCTWREHFGTYYICIYILPSMYVYVTIYTSICHQSNMKMDMYIMKMDMYI